MKKNNIKIFSYSGPALSPSCKSVLIVTAVFIWTITMWGAISVGVTLKGLSDYAEVRFNEAIAFPIGAVMMASLILSIIWCIGDAIYSAVRYGESLIRTQAIFYVNYEESLWGRVILDPSKDNGTIYHTNSFDSDLGAVMKAANNMKVIKDRVESMKNSDATNYDKWIKYKYYKIIKKNQNYMIVSTFKNREDAELNKRASRVRILNNNNDFDELINFISNNAMEVR